MKLSTEALKILSSYQLLRAYVKREVAFSVLASEELTPQQKTSSVEAFALKHKLANSQAIEHFRIAHFLDPIAFLAVIEYEARLRLHCHRLYRPKAEVRFLERKSQLDQVVYSLIRLSDYGLARELYLRLIGGEASFADLAAEFSEGSERRTRGIVGPIPLAKAHPRLVERLTTVCAGVVQEPFQIDRWWLVFRLESLTSACFDEAMAMQMSKELFEQWLEHQVEAQLLKLRPLLLTNGERSGA